MKYFIIPRTSGTFYHMKFHYGNPINYEDLEGWVIDENNLDNIPGTFIKMEYKNGYGN